MSAPVHATDAAPTSGGTTEASGAVPTPSVASTRAVFARGWRAGRVWLVVAVLLAVLVLVTVLRPSTPGQVLHPGSARPSGGQAVAEVLTAHGARIHPTDSLDQALSLAQEHPDAVLLFHDPGRLLPTDGLEQLAEQTDPARRVLVEPTTVQVRALAEGVTSGPMMPGSLETLSAGTDCDLPLAREAEEIAAEGRLYRGGTGCFNGNADSTGDSTVRPAHALVRSDEGTWVVGSARVLANDGAGDLGHPVVSLWTLGQSDDVIWYLPSLADVPAGAAPSDPSDLLPSWVGPATWWLVVCALILMLWRGRRHGPLAIEPLPVVVPSSETAVGRARLYQSTGQIGAAAHALHLATRQRLSRRLRLGRGASAAALTTAVAELTGQAATEVAVLLDEGTVQTAAELVNRARNLQRLEESVHTALSSTDHSAPTSSPQHRPDPHGPERTP